MKKSLLLFFVIIPALTHAQVIFNLPKEKTLADTPVVATPVPSGITVRGKLYRKATLADLDRDVVTVISKDDGETQIAWADLPEKVQDSFREKRAEALVRAAELRKAPATPRPVNYETGGDPFKIEPENIFVRGKLYHYATITDLERNTVKVVSSSDGSVEVEWIELPYPLQQKYNTKRSRARAQAILTAQKASATQRVLGHVIERVKSGLVINTGDRTVLLKNYPGETRAMPEDYVECWAAEDDTPYKYTPPVGLPKMLHAYRVVTPKL